jgi:SAM-dependent methyltransferase
MKFSNEQIREFWRNQAVSFADDHRASWTDIHAINLEIAEISKWLRDGMRVVDIGCANGFSTHHYASKFDIDIKGIDYIPEMVAAAKQLLLSQGKPLRGRAVFEAGDICSLGEPDAHYDVAVVTRVVINIPTREKQTVAIREAARVVKPGGMLLLSEATKEGLSQLNRFRSEWKLPPIPEPAFNNYVHEKLVGEAAPDLLELEQISNFSSTYFLGTRVLKPLLAGAIARDIDVVKPDMEWNRFFSLLPAAGDYGTQKLFVLRRK